MYYPYALASPLFLLSPMAIQIDIPPDLTDEDKALAFQVNDIVLNSQIFYALLHGGQQCLLLGYASVDW